MRPLRVYADTLVYGGVFDEEFRDTSRLFFDQVRAGIFQLVTSDLVYDELRDAPEEVRNLFSEMQDISENAEISQEVVLLQEEYLKAGIVGPQWETDALHVALATISQCQVLVSWNFKHLVNYQKITLYNAINAMNHYGNLAIYTPQEVVIHDNEDL
ncbi:MAG TPA: type II toxin-antitoxin system VapC family toxin [bacterium]|nr:type II toxin-antitoxin system VapC family toxin [bacterium]HQL60769.1 type II toxin-antitoxin system VapC family toxin [bacterium]